MSKSRQRVVSRRSRRRELAEHGARQAEIQKRTGGVDIWYPGSMAWRAGFLKAGGKRFWK